MYHTKHKAFTLVELIVVVTILAILATIGFVSYSSYLTGVRDTNRLAQMVSISDGLELYSTRKDLPLPDENVEIQANGSVIAYQGYAGSNTLETIDFTKGGQDPRDGEYFTYYLTDDRKYFQLLGFLEEEASASSYIIGKATAVDYSNRIPTVYGKKLGILTNAENTPVQEVTDIISDSFIDIATETDDYIAYFSDTVSVTGSGGSLLSASAVNYEDFLAYDTSLVTHFDFENNSLDDRSISEITGTLEGDAILEEIKGENALYSPIAADSYLDLGSPDILSSGLTDFSISVWTKLDADLYDGVSSTNYHILGNETYLGMGFEARIEHNPSTTLSAGVSFRTSISGSAGSVKAGPASYPNDHNWHHLTFVKDGTIGRVYIDGVEALSYSTYQSMNDYVASTKNFTIGSYGPGDGQQFDGHLDDVRIYNRAINADEVANLYLKEKKID